MLVAKLVLPVNVLLLVSLASEARYHSSLSRDDRSFHAWERQEQQDPYFEQCRFVSAWKEHLGYVSVLAFLDPAWRYSFRQAVMLELLRSRLRKSGFPDVRFFVISPPSDFMENERSEELDVELETWREIEAKHEMESFVSHDLFRGNGSEITFLRDDPPMFLWERFRASRDQVIIIDRWCLLGGRSICEKKISASLDNFRHTEIDLCSTDFPRDIHRTHYHLLDVLRTCGKLTYHVIVPWSILFFPYVKAAILSTYEEDPCGGCDLTNYQTPSPEEHVKSTTVTDEEEVNPTEQSKTNADVDATWTTESLEDATLLHESSSSTASSISLEEITNDTDRPTVSTESPTESTIYRDNNDAAEPRFDENLEGRWDQEDPTSKDGDTISSGTTASFEPQRDVLSPTQTAHPHPPANNSFTPANNNRDRTLLLDEPEIDETESNSTPADEKTTTSDLVDDVRDRNTTPENKERFGEDAFLPLRIIMYAPHVHKNGRKRKKYTHLILKTDDPDFHEHLDFGVDVASPMDSWRGGDSRITSSEEYGWETTEANADEENANQKFRFDGDESPGLYGEVADYWKSYEANDITDRNETFNDTYDNSTTSYDEEHRANVSDHATSLSKLEENHSIANIGGESLNVESFTDSQEIVDSDTIESFRPININNQVDREEEVQYKLNEHYKKLLPWLDYRLNK